MEDWFDDTFNGRVDIVSNKPTIKLVKCPELYSNLENNIHSHSYGHTQVSVVFFSNHNINILQEGIINTVYNQTNGRFKINRQSDTELKIIMRSIYFQYSKNNANDVVSQVKELNIKVLNWAVKDILTNIQQHEKFKRDVSSLPLPLERSQLSSLKGTKVLELKSFM